jgi:hypothetical protein
MNVFSQGNTTNDPFPGIWFVQHEGEKYVFIFVEGISITISNEWKLAEMNQYIVSENLIIFDEASPGSTVWQFYVISNNKIVMQEQDGDGDLWLLEKQSGNDVLKKMNNYFE